MDIQLTYEQEFIVNEAIKWFNNSSDTLFQIEGPAGTGKSAVLATIISRLGLTEDEILPMAYTGQAVSVLRKKGLKNAVTCHSGLYVYIEVPAVDDFGNYIMDTIHNVPKTELKRFDKNLKIFYPELKLIIVDECWMIPSDIKKKIDQTGYKVIAAGDSAQLPPVKGEPAYLIYGKVYHLTKLMRQSANSAIVQVALAAKNGERLRYGSYNNNEVLITDCEPSIVTYGRADITLCGHVETRNRINNDYRNYYLRAPSPLPLDNERMACKTNNWEHEIYGISLTNGLVGVVSNTTSTLDFEERHNNLFNIDFNTMGVTFRRLSCDYNFLIADEKTRDKIKNDKYKRKYGCKFDYAYACTVHSSQGSEYKKGIYIYENLPGGYNPNLHYTAITRFRDQLVIIIPPGTKYY